MMNDVLFGECSGVPFQNERGEQAAVHLKIEVQEREAARLRAELLAVLPRPSIAQPCPPLETSHAMLHVPQMSASAYAWSHDGAVGLVDQTRSELQYVKAQLPEDLRHEILRVRRENKLLQVARPPPLSPLVERGEPEHDHHVVTMRKFV